MGARFVGLVTTVAVIAGAFGGPAASAADTTPRWVRPVPGAVVRPFAAPRTAFGPGHRGVDLAAPPGTSVGSAGRGRVVFAGEVAGALHATVEHDGGLRTTYSYLAEVAVHVGTRVEPG